MIERTSRHLKLATGPADTWDMNTSRFAFLLLAANYVLWTDLACRAMGAVLA